MNQFLINNKSKHDQFAKQIVIMYQYGIYNKTNNL